MLSLYKENISKILKFHFVFKKLIPHRLISTKINLNLEEKLKFHASEDPLFKRVSENVDAQRQAMAQLKSNSNRFVQEINIGNIINGMKGITGLLCDTSLLDPNSGITFHDKTLKGTLNDLPKIPNSNFASPEALYYYLLTKSIPSIIDIQKLSQIIISYRFLPKHTIKILHELRHIHPMHQYIAAMASLANQSLLTTYYKTTEKSKYWQLAYFDSLALLAKSASISALVALNSHRCQWPKDLLESQIIDNNHKNDEQLMPFNDLTGYYMAIAAPVGINCKIKYTDFNQIQMDYLRLFLTIHADHEGGNVSSHASSLVGSALSDPYLSFCAALAGLAGPLHGRANQDVLDFVASFHDQYNDPSRDDIETFIKSKIESKHIIPGFGHAVLRVMDPRCDVQLDFARKYLKSSLDDNSKYLSTCSKMATIVPQLLIAQGRVSNPHANVDLISGSILYELGFTNQEYFTAIFGLSRSFGCMANYVTNHIYGYPLERPKSTTVKRLLSLIK